MNFLNFIEQPNPGHKTKIWDVRSTVDNTNSLGTILYRPGWRKYVFVPENSLFDAGCLTEIVNFLIQHKDDRQ